MAFLIVTNKPFAAAFMGAVTSAWPSTVPIKYNTNDYSITCQQLLTSIVKQEASRAFAQPEEKARQTYIFNCLQVLQRGLHWGSNKWRVSHDEAGLANQDAEQLLLHSDKDAERIANGGRFVADILCSRAGGSDIFRSGYGDVVEAGDERLSSLPSDLSVLFS